MSGADLTAVPRSAASNSEPTEQPPERDIATTIVSDREILKPPVAEPLPRQFEQSLLRIARRPRWP
jgi:hypothetical protein